MSRELPEWQPFDPASPPVPDIRASSDPSDGGAVIVLLESPESRERGWAARAAAALAGGLADQGRRVFLADVALERPTLHHVVGVENGEGVSDAFLYGASVQRIARPVADGRYFFASAGTVVADGKAVASSPRWEPILEGFRTARADVVLLVPAGQAGVPQLLERATDVVLLASPAEVEGLAVEGLEARVRAVLGPPRGSGAAPAAPGEDAAAAPFPAPPPAGAVPDAVPGAGEVAPAPRMTSEEPPPFPRRVPPRSGASRRPRTALLLVILLLVLAAAAVAWWFGLLKIPGLQAPPTATATAAPAPADVRPAPTAAPAAPVLASSLALGAFQDQALARRQRDGLRTLRPDLLFVLAPVEVGGTVYQRLLVGPALDSAGTLALRASLAATLPREDASRWVVRPTPLAWALGEAGDTAEARRRVEALDARDVPAYALEVPAPGGGRRYRLYAGAYADTAEAAWLGRFLTDEGVADAVLTERAGLPAPDAASGVSKPPA